MSSTDANRDIARIYDDLWNAGALEQWASAQEPLRPRSPSRLLDLVVGLGLGVSSRVLDAGCGQGDHACEIVERFGARVVALDPVQSNLERTRDRVNHKSLGSKIQLEKGLIEQLPFPDGHFDLVWCRSVIVHLPELQPAFRECWRVLARNGAMMVQTGFATELLEPREAEMLRRRLGFVETSMLRTKVEAAFSESGFTVVRSEAYGSEFAEFYEETEGRCAHHLTGIARLQRAEDALVARFGRPAYETALGMYYWQVFQMLGKISYHAYVVEKVPNGQR
jgi:ubiquinone/menaquinone biosynthesis C-methylase UbiE